MSYGNQPPGWGPPAPPGGGPPGWGPPPGGPPGYAPPGPFVPQGQPSGYPPPPVYQAQETGEFPPHLSMAPAQHRIDETFGGFPAAVAVAAFCGSVGTIITAIVEGGFDQVEQMYLVVVGFLIAPLFAFWEFWRRTHATSLVVMGGRIGIYRKAALVTVITGSQMTWFRLNFSNSLREYILYACCALALPGAFTQMLSPRTFGLAIWMLGIGIGGCLAFASTVWARGMCFHYYIPKNGGTETVILSKTKLRGLNAIANWPFPL